MTTPIAHAAGSFAIGGDLSVHRLGFGSMRIVGDGVWGPPVDPANSVAVLRRAVELGVDFVDTADSYGPAVSEELIRTALWPYREVTVATKAGFVRTGPGQWHVLGRPEYLTQQCELSLRRLGVETIDLFQLHRIDADVPLADQLGALVELQRAGKVRHIGLSQVSVDQLREAATHARIVTVQNLYNLTDRASEDVLAACEAADIGFIPWFLVATGSLARAGGPLDAVAQQTGVPPAQLALAWLLAKSPVMVPIPGTGQLAHLEQNVAAAAVQLTAEQIATLDALGDPERRPGVVGPGH
jgi:pyridoxine 4-dehydrogenase